MNQQNRTLLRYLSIYCDVNALGPNWQNKLRRTLETSKDDTAKIEFKIQLKSAIQENSLELKEFEKATHWGLDDEHELGEWLKDLWIHLYDEEFSDQK